MPDGPAIALRARKKLQTHRALATATRELALEDGLARPPDEPPLRALRRMLGWGASITDNLSWRWVFYVNIPIGLVALAVTSSFRSLGGSIGVALFGAVFNNSLRNRLGTSVAVGEGSSSSPAELADLPEGERASTVAAFADALTDVFLYATPVLVLAFFITTRMREAPLRRAMPGTAGDDAASGASAAALH